MISRYYTILPTVNKSVLLKFKSNEREDSIYITEGHKVIINYTVNDISRQIYGKINEISLVNAEEPNDRLIFKILNSLIVFSTITSINIIEIKNINSDSIITDPDPVPEAIMTLDKISFNDKGSYYYSSNAEEALQEIGLNLTKKISRLDLNEINERINNLVANTGDTNNNSELIDIRVGADNETYLTASESIKENDKRLMDVVLRKTNNILNIDKCISGYTLENWDVGVTTYNSIYTSEGLLGYTLSPIIKVEEGSTYICLNSSGNGVSVNQIGFYNSAGLSVSYSSGNIFTIPAGVLYVRFAKNSNAITQFKKVTDSYIYEPYGYVSHVPNIEEFNELKNTVKDLKVGANSNLISSFGTSLLKFSDITTVGEINTNYTKINDSTLKIVADYTTGISLSQSINKTINSNDIIGIMLYIGKESENLMTNVNIKFSTDATGNPWASYDVNQYNCVSGWNFVKFKKSDLYNVSALGTNNIKLITVLVKSTNISASTTVYLDSLMINPMQNPKIILNFDNGGDNFFNVVKPLLDNYNYRATVTYDWNSTDLYIKEYRKAIAEGHDYGLRLTSDNGITVEESWESEISLSKENGFTIPTTLMAPVNSGNIVWYNLAKIAGFKVYRKSPAYFINYFDKESFETGTCGINYNNLATVKGYIDKCISLGDSLSILTHQLTVGYDNNGTLNCPIEIYTELLEYIKTYVDQGLLEVITYKDFYNICVDDSRGFKEVDTDFIFNTIRSLSDKIYALENPS